MLFLFFLFAFLLKCTGSLFLFFFFTLIFSSFVSHIYSSLININFITKGSAMKTIPILYSHLIFTLVETFRPSNVSSSDPQFAL